MIGDFNFLNLTYLFYSDFNSRHGFFLIRKKKEKFYQTNKKIVSQAQWEESQSMGGRTW